MTSTIDPLRSGDVAAAGRRGSGEGARTTSSWRSAATCTPTPSCPGPRSAPPAGPRAAAAPPACSRAAAERHRPDLRHRHGRPGWSALRADLDALPLVDAKDVPYASTVPGVCHACGHDVHTAALLGAGLVLADLADEGQLPGRVRLIFQPAEESARAARWRDRGRRAADVERIFALHCDPRTDVGQVGLRSRARSPRPPTRCSSG